MSTIGAFVLRLAAAAVRNLPGDVWLTCSPGCARATLQRAADDIDGGRR